MTVIGAEPTTRLIRVTTDLLDLIGTRASDGRRLSYIWGDPDPSGVYEPTLTATFDGRVMVDAEEWARREGLADLGRELVRRWRDGSVERTEAEIIDAIEEAVS